MNEVVRIQWEIVRVKGNLRSVCSKLARVKHQDLDYSEYLASKKELSKRLLTLRLNLAQVEQPQE